MEEKLTSTSINNQLLRFLPRPRRDEQGRGEVPGVGSVPAGVAPLEPHLPHQLVRAAVSSAEEHVNPLATKRMVSHSRANSHLLTGKLFQMSEFTCRRLSLPGRLGAY